MQTQNQGTEQVHPDSESPKIGLRTTELCGRYISPEDNQVDTLHTDELLLPTWRPFTLQRQEASKLPTWYGTHSFQRGDPWNLFALQGTVNKVLEFIFFF